MSAPGADSRRRAPRTLGRARPSRAEAAAWIADDLPRRPARAPRRSARIATSTGGARYASGPRTARASRTRSTTSATCRCRRTSSATTRRAIAIGIRPCMRASAALSRRRRPASISRRSFSTALRKAGVERTAITLHVGYGTFQPVRVDRSKRTRSMPERFSISEAAAEAINRAKRDKRRVVAVGTTTTRALEAAGRGGTRHHHAAVGVDRPVHLPGLPVRHRRCADDELSSAAVVAADARRARSAAAMPCSPPIARRSRERYRFYSYGDAMLIL